MAGPRLESAAAECADVAERTYQWEGVRATPSLARPDFTAAGRGLGRELREEAARQKPARPSLLPLAATPPPSPALPSHPLSVPPPASAWPRQRAEQGRGEHQNMQMRV